MSKETLVGALAPLPLPVGVVLIAMGADHGEPWVAFGLLLVGGLLLGYCQGCLLSKRVP